MSTFLPSVKNFLTKTPHGAVVEREEIFPIAQYLIELSQASLLQNNLTSAVAPTVNDDSSLGYSIGSAWFDAVSGTLYFAQSVTAGAATWTPVLGGSGSGDIKSDGSVDFSGTETFQAGLITTFVSAAPASALLLKNDGNDNSINLSNSADITLDSNTPGGRQVKAVFDGSNDAYYLYEPATNIGYYFVGASSPLVPLACQGFRINAKSSAPDIIYEMGNTGVGGPVYFIKIVEGTGILVATSAGGMDMSGVAGDILFTVGKITTSTSSLNMNNIFPISAGDSMQWGDFTNTNYLAQDTSAAGSLGYIFGGKQFLFLDPTNHQFQLGDIANATSLTYLTVNSSTKQADFIADKITLIQAAGGGNAKYSIEGSDGAGGSFTAQSGEVITVKGGIITSIV